ncbi:hypothetical protein AQJ46_37940 [Streptomyces canus]|uniref:Uncharacterized protein n=1 Tax=Streptomyces canus TaxID=58343 RepID=A0A124HW41_9ACTN|nr:MULTISPECIES: hypothetical protein [Streptomyces]KUN60391.1 hypothetical protein AQJ46_37940 [Streptomyces canus]MDI5907900.1 hypothetical protein [Streptomyces sp. 12257]
MTDGEVRPRSTWPAPGFRHQVLPWSAGAEDRVGGRLVVAHLREADAHALAYGLDRFRAWGGGSAPDE